jgi:hypothetical protein
MQVRSAADSAWLDHSSVTHVMATLIARGVDFELRRDAAGDVVVHPHQTCPGAMSPHELSWLKARKPEVVALLTRAATYRDRIPEAKTMSTPQPRTTAAKPKAKRPPAKKRTSAAAATSPTFLAVNDDQMIAVRSVRGVRRNYFWTFDGTRQIVTLTLSLTGNREMTLRGVWVERTWKALAQHHTKGTR